MCFGWKQKNFLFISWRQQRNVLCSIVNKMVCERFLATVLTPSTLALLSNVSSFSTFEAYSFKNGCAFDGSYLYTKQILLLMCRVPYLMWRTFRNWCLGAKVNFELFLIKIWKPQALSSFSTSLIDNAGKYVCHYLTKFGFLSSTDRETHPERRPHACSSVPSVLDFCEVGAATCVDTQIWC